MRIFPSKQQWEKWKLLSRLAYIGFWIGIIALALSCYLLFFNNSLTKEDLRDIPSKTDLEIQYQNLRRDLFSLLNDSSDITFKQDSAYPGFSFQLMIKYVDFSPKKRKYIFDCGELNKNRISLFFDLQNNLLFELLDSYGIIHNISINHKSLDFDRVQLFNFEYGEMKHSHFLRIYSNKERLGYIEFHSSVNINIDNLIIGSDLSKKYSTEFYLIEFLSKKGATGTITFLINKLKQYELNQKVTTIYFDGDDWMKRNKDGDLEQINSPNQPLFFELSL